MTLVDQDSERWVVVSLSMTHGLHLPPNITLQHGTISCNGPVVCMKSRDPYLGLCFSGPGCHACFSAPQSQGPGCQQGAPTLPIAVLEMWDTPPRMPRACWISSSIPFFPLSLPLVLSFTGALVRAAPSTKNSFLHTWPPGRGKRSHFILTRHGLEQKTCSRTTLSMMALSPEVWGFSHRLAYFFISVIKVFGQSPGLYYSPLKCCLCVSSVTL